MGVIVWLYLDLKGEFTLEGELGLARLHPASLSVGVQKPSGGDFKLINSLERQSTDTRLIEAPYLNGTFTAALTSGISTDLDVFVGGIRLANAGLDVAAKAQMTLAGDLSYGTDNLGSPWTWQGDACFTSSIGAGVIVSAAAGAGVSIETKWKDWTGQFYYGVQYPTDAEMDLPGWHGGWFTVASEPVCVGCDSSNLDLCATQLSCTGAGGYWWADNTCNSTAESASGTVTSAGQVWMDRNLGASRVATSSTDSEAYGDLYQWGRGTDGHEKRDSSTTTTLSTTDTPGHGSFITTSSSPYDWRTPQNDNLWQGVSGVNNPCPSGFRLPTETELEIERASWSSNDSAGAYASPLKLVVAGFRNHVDGTVHYAGSYGHDWSSTVDGTRSRHLFFNSGYAYMSSRARAYGFSVRCLED